MKRNENEDRHPGVMTAMRFLGEAFLHFALTYSLARWKLRLLPEVFNRR